MEDGARERERERKGVGVSRICGGKIGRRKNMWRFTYLPLTFPFLLIDEGKYDVSRNVADQRGVAMPHKPLFDRYDAFNCINKEASKGSMPTSAGDFLNQYVYFL